MNLEAETIRQGGTADEHVSEGNWGCVQVDHVLHRENDRHEQAARICFRTWPGCEPEGLVTLRLGPPSP